LPDVWGTKVRKGKVLTLRQSLAKSWTKKQTLKKRANWKTTKKKKQNAKARKTGGRIKHSATQGNV